MTTLASNHQSLRKLCGAPPGRESKERAQACYDRPFDLLAGEFERFHAAVYRYLLHRIFDQELAEELTAETFYKAATAVKRLPVDAVQMQAWLLRVATNLANTRYRRRRLRQLLLGRYAGTRPTTVPPAGDSASPDEVRRAQVRAVMASLRPKYQAAVALRYYSRMSYRDIAIVQGCSEEAARARSSRAIREIRKRLVALRD